MILQRSNEANRHSGEDRALRYEFSIAGDVLERAALSAESRVASREPFSVPVIAYAPAEWPSPTASAR